HGVRRLPKPPRGARDSRDGDRLVLAEDAALSERYGWVYANATMATSLAVRGWPLIRGDAEWRRATPASTWAPRGARREDPGVRGARAALGLAGVHAADPAPRLSAARRALSGLERASERAPDGTSIEAPPEAQLACLSATRPCRCRRGPGARSFRRPGSS